jgi:hypothetical protein
MKIPRMKAMSTPTTTKIPARAPSLCKSPVRVDDWPEEGFETGFATTWVVNITEPLGSVDVLTKVITGGVVKDARPSTPVSVTGTADDSVESGGTVTMLMMVEGLGFTTVIETTVVLVVEEEALWLELVWWLLVGLGVGELVTTDVSTSESGFLVVVLVAWLEEEE